jgi:hypothetical protein
MADKTFDELQHDRRSRRGDFRDPKKHFVRKNGWLPVFESYSAQRARKVRYLTLCAKEAIDVRYFALKGVLYRNKDSNVYPSSRPIRRITQQLRRHSAASHFRSSVESRMLSWTLRTPAMMSCWPAFRMM